MSLLPGSIRGRLLLGLIVVLVGMNIALLSSSYTAARHEINEIFDAQLAESARVLEGLLAAGTPESASVLRESLERHGWQGMGGYDEEDEDEDEEGDEVRADGHEYERKLAFQLLDSAGHIQARTLSAPTSPFTQNAMGYDTVRLDGYSWRVFVLPLAQSDDTLQVGQRQDIRGELEGRIAWKTVQKSLYGLPLLALLVWLVVGVGLRPLSRLTDAISARDNKAFGPVAIRGVTRDLRPIVTALDSLFARLQQAWSRERRFLDEAAHELRTPLAAIQLHAESLYSETDPQARKQTLDRLLQASNRGSHLASQLLTLARIESNEIAVALKPTALAPLLREEAALMAPLAEQAGKSLALEAGPGLVAVRAEPGLLALLVRNLIDNAMRHSPEGGQVHIQAVMDNGRPTLLIDDEGAGIPVHLRERAMARFGRLSAHREGSGLGLAICARIAEQHGTQLELLDRQPAPGLRVRIRLVAA